MNKLTTLQLARTAAVVSTTGEHTPLGLQDAALLAWLALEGATPRERLAALLWPGVSAQSAGNSLRQRLFKLRRRWGDALISGQATLALAEGVRHDLEDAEDILGVQDCPGAEAFNLWLLQQRRRCAERARLLWSERAEQAEQARDFDTALALAQELLAREPDSEAAHRRVIRLQYLRGDRAAALQAFDRCERMLKHDIGAAPSAETLALLEAIESQGAGIPLQPAASVPAVVLRPPQLVGRQAELALGLSTLAQQGLVLLSGDAGMGKSRLIESLRERLGRRCVVVAARPGDDIAPYSLATRWLRALLQAAALEPTAAQRQDLARLLPEFGPPPSRSTDAERSLQQAACETLLVQAARQGLQALVIDDLQYADTASVQLLHGLVGVPACGWLLAMRPGELGPAQQALVNQHGGTARTATVALQPLGAGEVEALLGTLGLPGIGGPQQAGSLHRNTGGNPLYLLETLKAALAPGPHALALRTAPGDAAPAWPQAENVLRLIQQRLARLSPLAMKLTRCAAVAGPDLSSSLVARVLGLRPLDLADAWAELEAAQVLRQAAFAHDLIGEAARALVPEAIATALHAEVAAVLEQGSGDPARIAGHWTAAGEARKAVPHLQSAALRAAAAGQPLEAARLHERAAHTLREAGERRAAFDACFAAALSQSNVVQASDPRMQALAGLLAELAEDDGQRALEACLRVGALAETRQFDVAQQLLQQALAQAERAGMLDVQVELLWMQAAICWETRDLQVAVAAAERALQLLPHVDMAQTRLDMTDTGFKLQHGLGRMLTATGHYAQGEARMEEALRLARQDRDRSRCSGIAHSLSVCAVERGDLVQALRWSEEALADDAAEGAHPNPRLRALGHAVLVCTLAGELGTALQHAQRLEHLSTAEPVRNGPAALRRVYALYVELGRRDLALKGLRALRQLPDLPAVERTAADATLASMGEPVDAAPLLEAVVAIEDFALRARLLGLAAPACEPALVLPVLSVTAVAAREQGAIGTWLGLQARRAAVLRALGRDAEATEIMLALWPFVDRGVIAAEPFPHIAAGLCLGLLSSHGALAKTLSMRVSAWMLQAASTLPAPWRENYLARAPALASTRAVVARLGFQDGTNP